MSKASKSLRGQRSYHAGKAAEDRVCRDYLERGYVLLARRWRGPAGEIDLILEQDGTLIVVEVKQSKTFARAARHLTQRQIARLYRSAGDCLRFFAAGQHTPLRFDVALVDGVGHVDIVPNAIMA